MTGHNFVNQRRDPKIRRLMYNILIYLGYSVLAARAVRDWTWQHFMGFICYNTTNENYEPEKT